MTTDICDAMVGAIYGMTASNIRFMHSHVSYKDDKCICFFVYLEWDVFIFTHDLIILIS